MINDEIIYHTYYQSNMKYDMLFLLIYYLIPYPFNQTSPKNSIM